MSILRSNTTMLLGFLLISLLALNDFIVHANHVNGLLMQGRSIDQKDGEKKYNYMKVSKTRSKMIGRRKMGVNYYVEEKKESSMNTVKKQDLLEAATQEIFNMMKKDYGSRGRHRPPLPNNIPSSHP